MEGRPLSEEDLKLVARLGNLLTQRPQGSRGQTMNHKVTAPITPPFAAHGRVPCVKDMTALCQELVAVLACCM